MKKEINMRKDLPSREQGSRIITDPNGSYTGVSVDDKYAEPVQDVDDL